MVKKLFKLILVSLSAIAIATINSHSLSAVETPGLRLQVSPPIQEIKLSPGAKYSGNFQVQNTGSKELKYKVSVEPYSVLGEDYSPDYVSETTYTKIVSWITLDTNEGFVSPGSVVDVNYSISVPLDAPGGSQHATLFAELIDPENDEKNQENSASIQNVSRVGSIIYAKIDGDTYEKAEISDNKIKSFILTPPIVASSIIKNTGNVDLNATYTLWVYSMFDDMTKIEPLYSNEQAPTTKVIMPDTQRLNIMKWDDVPRLGIFRVVQSVEVLGEVSTTEKIVVVCPIWFAAVIFILIILCAMWLARRFRKKR